MFLQCVTWPLGVLPFLMRVARIDKTTYNGRVEPLIFGISATACAVQ